MEPTREDYKLIAEFMGWTLDDADTDMYRKPEGYVNIYRKLANFNFHTDWNELMKVVNKIEKLYHSVFISSSMVYVSGDEGTVVLPITIYNEGGYTKIEAVYLACVAFIKWHNLTKKK